MKDSVQKDWADDMRLNFNSIFGAHTICRGAEKGVWLEIVYHSYIIEETRFLEDLFWKTKAFKLLGRAYCMKLFRMLD